MKGWVEYYKEIEKFSDIFERPSVSEVTRANDIFLLLFYFRHYWNA
jgi:hypothetical protein